MKKIRSNIYTVLFLVVLSVTLLAFGCRGMGGDAAAPIKEYKGNISLSDDQQKSLLAAARIGLASGTVPQMDSSLQGIGGAGAVVELFLPPNKPVIHVVGGDDFSVAFLAAVKKAASDSRFQSAFKPNLDRARIKISIIERLFRLRYNPKDQDEKTFRRISRKVEDGIHGFILEQENKATYQIPERVLYDGLGLDLSIRDEKKNRMMGRKLVRRQLQALGKEAAQNPHAWKNGNLYAFRTVSFIDKAGEPGTPVLSYRAKNMIPSLTGESLRAAAAANADYLARIVDDKGKFVYVYYPNEDKNDPGYGIVRHAGSVYGLFEAYNFLGDKKYFDAGRKALDYLLSMIEIPQQAPQIAIVKDRGKSVLGTNALVTLAFAAMPEEFMTDKDKEYREKLGESILYFRMPEPGYFYTSFDQAVRKRPPREQALYFPGEAMLALVRLYERTGDKKWWDAAVEISPGQKILWEKEGHAFVGNYCWVGQAWARMARLEKDPAKREEYKRLGYSHADAVLMHQWTPDRDGYYPDYLGGADNSKPPRTTPTSARGESLSENYLTAKFLGDVESQKRYGVALLQAIHFFVQNQFTDENSWFLPYPEKARGGIRGSLIANDIRIDYNQHALTTKFNALGAPDELKAIGVTQW